MCRLKNNHRFACRFQVGYGWHFRDVSTFVDFNFLAVWQFREGCFQFLHGSWFAGQAHGCCLKMAWIARRTSWLSRQSFLAQNSRMDCFKVGEMIAWMVSGDVPVVIGIGLLHVYLSGVCCLLERCWIIVEFMVGILIFR